jgi:hypothetical protein
VAGLSEKVWGQCRGDWTVSETSWSSGGIRQGVERVSVLGGGAWPGEDDEADDEEEEALVLFVFLLLLLRLLLVFCS